MRCNWQFPCVQLLWKHSTFISNKNGYQLWFDELLKKAWGYSIQYLLKSILQVRYQWARPVVGYQNLPYALQSGREAQLFFKVVYQSCLSQQDNNQAAFRHKVNWIVSLTTGVGLSFVRKGSMDEYLQKVPSFVSFVAKSMWPILSCTTPITENWGRCIKDK